MQSMDRKKRNGDVPATITAEQKQIQVAQKKSDDINQVLFEITSAVHSSKTCPICLRESIIY
jgi:hypothetical protein